MIEPTVAEFDATMRDRGWQRFQGVLPPEQVVALCADADRVYEICRTWQIRNGVAAKTEGAAHHVAGYGGALDAFLDPFPLSHWIDHYFGAKWTLLNFGAAMAPPGITNYTARPHRDIRWFSGDYRLSLNMLVMLSDFTEETGATLILSGSHRHESIPAVDAFIAGAEPILGKAGDIVLFDSLTVHSAALNQSKARRHALTICLGRPFIKPQVDWTRFLPASFQEQMSPEVRQLMGFNARSAASLEEYYQPPERWAFQPDQR